MASTTTGASATAGASGRSSTRKTATNGKPPNTITVRGTKLQIRRPIRLGLYQQFSEEGDVKGLLSCLLTDEAMERMWDIELPGENLTEELDDVLSEVVKKVSEAVGLTSGE